MTMTPENKQQIVSEVLAVASTALSIVGADYRGLTVSEMTALRVKARNAGVHLRVVRNTLARRAFENTEFACMSDALTGPLVLAFAKEEPGAAARVFRDFAKTCDKLQVKVIALSGRLYDVAQLNVVANLPTKTEALSTLLATLQAPATTLVRTLVAPHEKLVRTFAALRDQKQAAA